MMGVNQNSLEKYGIKLAERIGFEVLQGENGMS